MCIFVGWGVGDLFLPPDRLLALPPTLFPAVTGSRLGERFLGEGDRRCFFGDGEEEAAGLGASFFSSIFLLPPDDFDFISFFDFLDFFLLSLSLLDSLELELDSLLESLEELLLELLAFLFFFSFSLLSLLLGFLSSPELSELLSRDFRPFSFSSPFSLLFSSAPPVPGAMLFK